MQTMNSCLLQKINSLKADLINLDERLKPRSSFIQQSFCDQCQKCHGLCQQEKLQPENIQRQGYKLLDRISTNESFKQLFTEVYFTTDYFNSLMKGGRFQQLLSKSFELIHLLLDSYQSQNYRDNRNNGSVCVHKHVFEPIEYRDVSMYHHVDNGTRIKSNNSDRSTLTPYKIVDHNAPTSYSKMLSYKAPSMKQQNSSILLSPSTPIPSNATIRLHPYQSYVIKPKRQESPVLQMQHQPLMANTNSRLNSFQSQNAKYVRIDQPQLLQTQSLQTPANVITKHHLTQSQSTKHKTDDSAIIQHQSLLSPTNMNARLLQSQTTIHKSQNSDVFLKPNLFKSVKTYTPVPTILKTSIEEIPKQNNTLEQKSTELIKNPSKQLQKLNVLLTNLISQDFGPIKTRISDSNKQFQDQIAKKNISMQIQPFDQSEESPVKSRKLRCDSLTNIPDQLQDHMTANPCYQCGSFNQIKEQPKIESRDKISPEFNKGIPLENRFFRKVSPLKSKISRLSNRSPQSLSPNRTSSVERFPKDDLKLQMLSVDNVPKKRKANEPKRNFNIITNL